MVQKAKAELKLAGDEADLKNAKEQGEIAIKQAEA